MKRFERASWGNEDYAKDHLELDVIYASAPIGLCLLDTDTRYLRVNRQLAELNGLSVEEHIGKRVRELVPDLADVAEDLVRRVVETGEPVLDLEIRGETPAQPGVARCWKENWWPLKDDRGRVVAINIVVEEITERKRVEEALRKSEERFRLLTENASDIVVVLDAEGHIRYKTPSAKQVGGYAAEDLIGRSGFKLIHPDDLPLAMDGLRTLAAHPKEKVTMKPGSGTAQEAGSTLM